MNSRNITGTNNNGGNPSCQDVQVRFRGVCHHMLRLFVPNNGVSLREYCRYCMSNPFHQTWSRSSLKEEQITTMKKFVDVFAILPDGPVEQSNEIKVHFICLFCLVSGHLNFSHCDSRVFVEHPWLWSPVPYMFPPGQCAVTHTWSTSRDWMGSKLTWLNRHYGRQIFAIKCGRKVHFF